MSHTQAIVTESAPVCPPAQAKYRMAFPSDVLLPRITWFARIFCCRISASHSLSFTFSKYGELGRLWRPLSPWCCDRLLSTRLRVSQWEACLCPSEDMSQHCLLLWAIGQAAKVDFELLDPPASTSQVPGLGVRHPAQCDYAAFHRTAKYIQDESKLNPECSKPSLLKRTVCYLFCNDPHAVE